MLIVFVQNIDFISKGVVFKNENQRQLRPSCSAVNSAWGHQYIYKYNSNDIFFVPCWCYLYQVHRLRIACLLSAHWFATSYPWIANGVLLGVQAFGTEGFTGSAGYEEEHGPGPGPGPWLGHRQMQIGSRQIGNGQQAIGKRQEASGNEQ